MLFLVFSFFKECFGSSFLVRKCQWFHYQYSFLCGAFIFMTLASFFGLFKPYKIRKHNLYDVLIFCLTAMQSLVFFMTLSVYKFNATLFHVFTAIHFGWFFLFIFHMFRPFLMSFIC